MTTQDIDSAVKKILTDKDLKTQLNLDKKKVYDLRHRSSLAVKLELLYNAGYLQINEPTQPQITTK